MPKAAASGRSLAAALVVGAAVMTLVAAIAGHLVPASGAATVAAAGPAPAALQQQGEAARPFTVVARRYDFSPNRIEVVEGNVVKITLEASDIPHSFTVDAYRIAKRATPGHPTVFEFRADAPGEFDYYCNLTIDEGCRRMKGTLVVKPRPR